MKKAIRVSLVALVLLLALTIVVQAQEGEPTEAATAGEVALLLAPLVAAATAIERMLEMVFSYFENMVISASKFVNLAGDYATWAQKQVQTCRTNLLGTAADDHDAIQRAEENLREAEQRLKDWVKSEPYVSKKQALSVVGGILLGLIVAVAGRLQMFKLLGIDLVAMNSATGTVAQLLAGVDVVVTGLVIGTGSAPVHSLIGILQKSKDTIDEVRALTRAKSINTLGLFPGAVPSAAIPGGAAEPLSKAAGAPAPPSAPAGAAVPPSKAAAAPPTALEMERLASRLLD